MHSCYFSLKLVLSLILGHFISTVKPHSRLVLSAKPKLEDVQYVTAANKLHFVNESRTVCAISNSNNFNK